MLFTIRSIDFAIPPINNRQDEITIVVNISGTNAETTQSGVAKNICGISNINIGKIKCNKINMDILTRNLPVVSRFLYIIIKHKGSIEIAKTTKYMQDRKGNAL